jgi:phospholipase/carboxylesterase
MKGFSLNYLVRPAIIEQENGKSPAVFMLHGYGQNKEEFFSIIIGKTKCTKSQNEKYIF